MSVDIRSSDRRRFLTEISPREKEIIVSDHLNVPQQPESPKLGLETDKRHRREIANSNERRRMQCINAGFSNLRSLIPQLEGEKLSKATILQHTAEYISNMEKEKRHLQQQLEQSVRLLNDLGGQGSQANTSSAAVATVGSDGFVAACSSPPSKRKKRITESSDEGVGAMSDESDDGGQVSELLRQENANLKQQVEAERRRCQALEESNRMLESRLHSVLHFSHVQEVVAKSEVHPTTASVHDSLYNQEVVEVIGTMESMPTPPREDPSSIQHYTQQFQPPRPLSPTPERGMAVELSAPRVIVEPVVPTSQPISSTLMHFDNSPLLRASLSPAIKPAVNVDGVICKTEPSTPGVTFQRVLVADDVERRSSENITLSYTADESTTGSTTTRQEDVPMRVFQHRDHPRRRHRQQQKLVKLQQEEEQRRREEEELRQQNRVLFSAPAAVSAQGFRPSQNLENLVEAIRHIEGEGALCDSATMYPEEQYAGYDKRRVSFEESSSMSDPDELKSESSGRDSPQHLHRLQPLSYHPHQIDNQQQHHLAERLGHQVPQFSIAATTLALSLSSLSSSESENMSPKPVFVVSSNLSSEHPTTASLLHSKPFYKPGVIVPK